MIEKKVDAYREDFQSKDHRKNKRKQILGIIITTFEFSIHRCCGYQQERNL